MNRTRRHLEEDMESKVTRLEIKKKSTRIEKKREKLIFRAEERKSRREYRK